MTQIDKPDGHEPIFAVSRRGVAVDRPAIEQAPRIAKVEAAIRDGPEPFGLIPVELHTTIYAIAAGGGKEISGYAFANPAETSHQCVPTAWKPLPPAHHPAIGAPLFGNGPDMNEAQETVRWATGSRLSAPPGRSDAKC